MVENINLEKDKVFFIISNESNLNSSIKYSLLKNKGTINFNEILKIIDNKSNYTTYVYSFEIEPKYLKNKDNSELYEAKIGLKYKKLYFEEIIKFKKDKNNFIYNFKFHTDSKKNKEPPKCINYSKFEQLQLFKNILEKLNIGKEEKLYNNLIIDSIGFRTDIYDFDYYLEILKSCISQKERLLLLNNFNLRKIKYLKNMNIKEYLPFLEKLEQNTNNILISNKESEKDIYLEKFYSLLFYFYDIFGEQTKINILLKKIELRKYFLKIIENYYLYDDISLNVKLPDEFIFEVLNTKKILDKKNLNKLISLRDYEYNLEIILFFIKNNCETFVNNLNISQFYHYNADIGIGFNKILNIPQFYIGNLDKVIIYTKNIIDYEINSKNEFLFFDESYWNILLENIVKNINYDNYEKYKNIILIKKLSHNKINYQKIHNELFKILKNLENEKLIEYIEKILEDNTFVSQNELFSLVNNNLFEIMTLDKKMYPKESEVFVSRLFNIVYEGINLNKANNKFIEIWNKSKKFKYIFIKIMPYSL